jgi:hypothetical protein
MVQILEAMQDRLVNEVPGQSHSTLRTLQGISCKSCSNGSSGTTTFPGKDRRRLDPGMAMFFS